MDLTPLVHILQTMKSVESAGLGSELADWGIFPKFCFPLNGPNFMCPWWNVVE